jgi:hypothetical protein
MSCAIFGLLTSPFSNYRPLVLIAVLKWRLEVTYVCEIVGVGLRY